MNTRILNGLPFVKYHGLGNDYMVVDADALAAVGADSDVVKQACDRHYGPGADGVLIDHGLAAGGAVRVSIVNPDGSRAEKSGNGLRIFARYLFDQGRVEEEKPFAILTDAGVVQARLHANSGEVTVEMGQASFDAAVVPVSGFTGDVVEAELDVEGESVLFTAVTVGNPHCVVFGEATRVKALRLGPLLERFPCFVNRTNVQFAEVLSRDRVRIEIWERGAGYTLASGSSSCAAAAAAFRRGLVDPDVTVEMPGGELRISIGSDFSLTMRGPVVKVVSGTMAPEMFAVSVPG